MNKKLTEGKNCDYVVTVSFWNEDKSKVRSHVLEHFAQDMKVPGFRPWKVPMHIVEQNVQPAYVEMAITEHLINEAIQEILKENKEIKFIGEPYGYDTKDDKGTTTVTFHLDIYPEVKVDGKKRESIKMKAIKVEATEKEVEDSLLNIQKNYADYKDADKISDKNTISKLGLEFLDKDNNVVDKGTTYLWETEFNEDKFWSKTFNWKNKKDEIELTYDEKKLPHVLHAKKWEPKKLKITIQDVKEIVLPELDDKMIEKLFGKDAEVKTNAELKAYIKKEIISQKEENELVQAIENYITDVRKSGVNVVIPKTMIEQEFRVRMDNLKHRFWSEEKVKEYFTQLWEEKAKEFVDGVQSAAAESLEKFFILNKITELLWLSIDWSDKNQEPLFVEKQIYTKLVGSLPGKEEKAPKKTVKKNTKKEEK